ncbi:MAG TPA: amidohydrolase [Cyclobacteriaceae bacterium]|jgi:amidohydrolase|nr:amidohydrolase [Cyclobacteriaceae bacterium]HNT51529.1 amidohydrolase [Cyclobacteriaceae bacterium]HRE65336.1 amidohydrolase [Cyclobacteriaceae bacterium]HRF35366.1 amidohydrolase [Cyclobacteriaceae bacterium]
MKLCSFVLCLLVTQTIAQVNPKLQIKLDQQAREIEPRVVEWRRHLHQNPELSNRETQTAIYIAEHLKKLGLKVQTGVAHTGVVALLETGKPGPVIALRADMDALPVTERNSLPFASKVKATFNGQETGVMHACGHDSHVAILMGVTEILVKNKADLKGTIKFIFQPAEEGAPVGEEGGASMMVKEGVLQNPKVETIFGLHISSVTPLGKLTYKPGGMMAASDNYSVRVLGKQAHGSTPWMSIDPIVVSAQIINGLQTIISRQTELTKEAAVITVGRINAGIRENIIPEEAFFAGTIRTLDTGMQDKIHEKIKLTATKIAESAGAKAEVTIRRGTPVTYNDPARTQKMIPSLQKAAGVANTYEVNAITGAEDFAFYQKEIPGFFFFLGAMPPDTDPTKVPSHHTPDFMIDEQAFVTGVKAMLNVTVDYMFAKK